MSRASRLTYYGIPMLFCLAVHWLDLKMWFWGDDFAWLGMRLDVHSFSDFLDALFRPHAQGTVRTISERLFFLTFSSIFGLEAPPFRIWVFLTQFANIALLMQVTRRVTGSPAAGFIAPILWSANTGLGLALGWTSAYNEIAFAFVLLLSFRLLLLHIDTGERKYWIWQWVAFLLGFGVLELIVTYPVIASGYTFCCARKYFRKTLLLFLPSIAFTAVHLTLIPKTTDPYYRMYLDSSIFTTLWRYWSYALGALREDPVGWRPTWLGVSLTIAITAALLAFIASRMRRREWSPVVLLGWFFIVILPVLPLRNHFTEYYVCVPAIGLSILAAWALVQARGYLAPVAFVLAGLYIAVSIAENHVVEHYRYGPSREIKHLITALQRLPKTEVSKKILLAGVDNRFFWSAFSDDPFRLIGLSEIYLVPGTEKNIDPHLEWGGISRFVISSNDAFVALATDRARVYELQNRQLRDLTSVYRALIQPDSVDAGNPIYESRLGSGWYPIENGFRWMSKVASVNLPGPKKAGQRLDVTGYCPAVLVAGGPLRVSFRIGQTKLGDYTLAKPGGDFHFELPLPGELAGRQTVTLEVEVSRTLQTKADPRALGLIFGTFTMK